MIFSQVNFGEESVGHHIVPGIVDLGETNTLPLHLHPNTGTMQLSRGGQKEDRS